MLKKRASIVIAAVFTLVLLMSFATTVSALGPSISVSANFGGSGTGYGYVNGYLDLTINTTSNVTPSSHTLTLSLPSTVSISGVSGGTRSGNTITPNQANGTVVVQLFCADVSSRVYTSYYGNPLYYRADSIRVTYSASDGTGMATTNTSVDVAVRSNSADSTQVVSSSSNNYNSGYWNGNYCYPNYYSTTNPTYYYGSGYNGVYYYDYINGISRYGTYNPYSQLESYYGMSISPSSLSLGAGQSQQLSVTVGAYGSTYGISWTSSNAQVAAVDSNGLVTGLSSGTATITARSTYGTTATSTVTVGYSGASTVVPSTASAEVKSLSFAKVKTKLSVGEAVQMYINIKPSSIDYGSTQLVSSDTNVIQVLDGGIVSAVGSGTATVYFTFGGKTALCTFTVK